MSIQQKWQAYFLSPTIRKVHSEMGGKYNPTDGRRMRIAKALMLWEFIRIIRRAEENKYSGADIRKWIQSIIITPGTPAETRIVAMLEFLPEKVLRAFLWRENIDFPAPTQGESSLQCLEACIRRFTLEQYIALQNTYKQVIINALPDAMKPLSWLAKMLYVIRSIFVNPKSIEAMWEADDSITLTDSKRYLSKSAWAYNFLGIDFGFALYPKGVNDDTIVANKSFTRFLSVKNHVNDFVVNQEDGMYWILYKTARSNYVINPGADVQLKPHVCPGFWATLFRHFLFWVISPILCFILIPGKLYWHFGSVWQALSSIGSIALWLGASITPAWCFTAILRRLIVGVVDILHKMISDKTEKKWETMRRRMSKAIAPYWRRFVKVVRVIGIITLILGCCFAIWWVGDQIRIHLQEIIAALSSFWQYVKNLFSNIYHFFADNISKHLLILTLIYLSWKTLKVMSLAWDLDDKFEKEVRKGFRYILLLVVATVIAGWYCWQNMPGEWFYEGPNMWITIIGFLAFSGVMVAILGYEQFREYKSTLKTRQEIKDVLKNQDFQRGKSDHDILPYKVALSNAFFALESKDNKKSILSRIRWATYDVGEKAYWFGLKLIRKWTPEIDTQLRIAQDAGNNESGVIQFLFDGMTYENAVAKFKEVEEIKKAAKIAAEEKEQKRREKRIKRKNAWRQFSTKNKWRLLLPFTLIIYIFKGIWWLIRKIFWEVPITLRNLWVLFYRDACPYITKQKQI